MVTHYADHAANERTFLAWIRIGLAVVAFGLFLFKLNVLVDAGDGTCPAYLRKTPACWLQSRRAMLGWPWW
jgi:putative membrane protein